MTDYGTIELIIIIIIIGMIIVWTVVVKRPVQPKDVRAYFRFT